MKEIYLIRHSKPYRPLYQKMIEKFVTPLKFNMITPIGKEGIKIASSILSNKELDDIDAIYSSNYKRAYMTSLILSKRLNKKVVIDNRFGERIHGIKKSYSELPDDFELRQFKEPNFKMKDGESQIEVQTRMLEGISDILEKDDQKIAVFTHSTALRFLLLKWCKLDYDNKKIIYKDKVFNSKTNYVEIFKLTFDKEELIDINLL